MISAEAHSAMHEHLTLLQAQAQGTINVGFKIAMPNIEDFVSQAIIDKIEKYHQSKD
jgi:hypothetical protein